MKRIISFLLAVSLLLTGCQTGGQVDQEDIIDENVSLYEDSLGNFSNHTYTGLNDRRLLQDVEDDIYSDLVNRFDSEDYIIENVQAVYVSKEYIDELSAYSRENIYFGYTESELYEQFQGEKYIFTLGDDGTTVVKKLEDYDDSYSQMVKDIAIGSGVILVCVTVSVATAGAGMPAVSMVFAASAKTAAQFAVSSAILSGVASGVVTAYQTGGDVEETVKNAGLAASEGFKVGAISGALTGGFTKLSQIVSKKVALKNVKKFKTNEVRIDDTYPEWKKAELRVLNKQGGYNQVSYLKGKKVSYGTPKASRPDVIRDCIDHIEAVEVKCYNIADSKSRSNLYGVLRKEISSRCVNLPKNSTQRIVLDVTNKGIDKEFALEVAEHIRNKVLNDIYPDIPIDIVGAI